MARKTLGLEMPWILVFQSVTVLYGRTYLGFQVSDTGDLKTFWDRAS